MDDEEFKAFFPFSAKRENVIHKERKKTEKGELEYFTCFSIKCEQEN
jgi:hypothetical protein